MNAPAYSQTGCSGFGASAGALPLIAGNGVIPQSDAGPRPKLSERQIVNNSTRQMSWT